MFITNYYVLLLKKQNFGLQYVKILVSKLVNYPVLCIKNYSF